jgi:MFS family permease
MLKTFTGIWPLLLGMMLLQVGNGLQGTLLGVRGGIEGFSTTQMSWVMSGYFAGFLFGSRMAPGLIRRVGHVRVFAALGSMISAVLILYPVILDPWAWMAGRVLIGFCFSGVYVTAESWLNNSSSNETRGQTLSLYMIVQMVGIVSAQGLMVVADPSGFILFVISSVLVSIAFAPILLSVTPAPAFESAKPMSLRQILHVSPLGAVGMFLLGGAFSAQFGMSAVYGAEVGLSTGQISGFVAMFFVGAMLFQYPLGRLSDRMDRRILILAASLIAASGAMIGMIYRFDFNMLLVSAFLIGGMTTPLYSLVLAHTNDFLDHDDMASAAGGMVFINGLGAIGGPMVMAWAMGAIGPQGYFLFIAILMIMLVGYAAYRMTQRAAPDETESYTHVMPASTSVAVEWAQEHAIETAQENTEM